MNSRIRATFCSRVIAAHFSFSDIYLCGDHVRTFQHFMHVAEHRRYGWALFEFHSWWQRGCRFHTTRRAVIFWPRLCVCFSLHDFWRTRWPPHSSLRFLLFFLVVAYPKKTQLKHQSFGRWVGLFGWTFVWRIWTSRSMPQTLIFVFYDLKSVQIWTKIWPNRDRGGFSMFFLSKDVYVTFLWGETQ